jgi:hypothetical protein
LLAAAAAAFRFFSCTRTLKIILQIKHNVLWGSRFFYFLDCQYLTTEFGLLAKEF